MIGRVITFDEHVGLGIIESNDEKIPFHCVNIADGTRTINLGAEVTFEKFMHPQGREEATNIVKL